MKKFNIKKLIFYVGITLLIGSFPSFFIKIGETYKTINKPPLSPSGIVFPIIWTILFILMGISIYLIDNSNSNKKKECRLIYFIGLFVNALWTPIFFGFKEYFLAFLWILMLIVIVVTTILLFYKEKKISAYLLIPYLCWLLFACYLNFGVFILN